MFYDKSVYFQLYHGENRVIFWCDVDYICVVVDQRAQLDIYSSWSLIQEPHDLDRDRESYRRTTTLVKSMLTIVSLRQLYASIKY